jgi:hypothetical protein
MGFISSGLGLEVENDQSAACDLRRRTTLLLPNKLGHRNLFYQLSSSNLSVIKDQFAIIPRLLSSQTPALQFCAAVLAIPGRN